MTCKWYEICELRDLEEQNKISDKWKKQYCETQDNWENCKRYQLEENRIPHENLLPDGSKIRSEK